MEIFEIGDEIRSPTMSNWTKVIDKEEVNHIIIKYKTLEDIPERYKELIEQLIDRGIIVSDGRELEYPLDEDMLYLIKVIQRMN